MNFSKRNTPESHFLVFKASAYTRVRISYSYKLSTFFFHRLTSSGPHSPSPDFTSQHHTQSDHQSTSKDNYAGRSCALCGVLPDAGWSRRTRQSSNRLGEYLCGKMCCNEFSLTTTLWKVSKKSAENPGYKDKGTKPSYPSKFVEVHSQTPPLCPNPPPSPPVVALWTR